MTSDREFVQVIAPSDSSADWNTDNNLLASQIVTPGSSNNLTVADGSPPVSTT